MASSLDDVDSEATEITKGDMDLTLTSVLPSARWSRRPGRRIGHAGPVAGAEFDIGYRLVTHEGAGLLTTYGGVLMARPDSRGVRLGGRIELGEGVDLSVEGERTTQGGGGTHQVALYGHLG